MEEYRIEGRNTVKEALKSGRDIDKIYIQKDGDGRLRELKRLAKEHKTVIIETERRKLDEISGGGAHQGIIAFCSAVSYCTVEDILTFAAEKNEPPLIIIADGLTDPHNLGAVIRSAFAAGAHGLIIPKRRSCGINETVEKAAAGAAQHLRIAKVVNIAGAVETLKKNGVWITGTDLSAEKAHFEMDFTGSTGIIIGSEGEGISRIVREKCDFLTKIPMAGEIQSLNASVAAGIVLFEAVRQRIQ